MNGLKTLRSLRSLRLKIRVKGSILLFPAAARAVSRRRFTQRVGGFHGHPNGFAISPDGERPAALPVVLHDLGNGFGQSLHGLLGERRPGCFLHGAN